MEIIIVLLLILLGIILLLVEFLLIPGISIAGIGSAIALVLGTVLAFKYWGTLVGIIVLICIVIIVPVMLYFLFKSRAMKKMILNSDIDGKVTAFDEKQIKIGDMGETIGRLAPMGKARFNGISAETRSMGGYIDPRTKVRVVKFEGNTVIVEPINE